MDPVFTNAPEADSGIYEADVTKKRFWRDTPVERRETLMPFLWKTLAPAGVVFGNQAKGSKVTVRNDQWFSYPGYSEILTGQPQPEVKSNDFVRYPHRTALEYAHDTLGLGYGDVVQIGSWDGFKYAASQKDGVFLMNGARDPFPPQYWSTRRSTISLTSARTSSGLLGRKQQRRPVLSHRDGLPQEVPAARHVARARPVRRLGARPPL